MLHNRNGLRGPRTSTICGTGTGQCLSSPCACACVVITTVIASVCLTYTGQDDLPDLKEIAQFLTHQKSLKHLTLSLNVSVVYMHISLLLYWQVVFQQPGDVLACQFTATESCVYHSSSCICTLLRVTGLPYFHRR